MTEIVVNPRHNHNSNIISTSGYNVKFGPVNKWLTEHGLEFNHDYGVGWEWLNDDDLNFTPVITFSDHVDPRIITAFALRWS